MDFINVSKELTRQELEDLMVEAYSPDGSGAFNVERISTIGGMKEIAIKYLETGQRRLIILGKKTTQGA